LQFSGEIYNTTYITKAFLINTNLYRAGEFLDRALILFTCNKSESAKIQIKRAIFSLKKAKWTILLFKNLGFLSTEIAKYYLTQSNNFIGKLVLLINSL